MKNKHECENTTVNKGPARADMVPLKIAPAAFLAAFGPGPYCLRSFADGGGGPGRNLTVADQAGLLAALAELRRLNQAQRRGVFFVVNAGGHKDSAITRVTAHFVEADALPLATQWDNLMAFPLPPSIVVRTRKSLHGYWLMAESDDPGRSRIAPTNQEPVAVAKSGAATGAEPTSIQTTPADQLPASDPNLAQFRRIQQQLAAHFGGDPVIANPSRVMRLPGFDHHKAEPVAVVCLLFEPQRRYSQAQLAATLAALHPDEPRFAGTAATATATAAPTKTAAVAALDHPRGDYDLAKLLRECAFIRHCQDHAATLPEPLWYPMITNLADLPGGEAAIQRLSSSHPGYSPAATAAKIAQYRQSGTAPFTCATIAAWGFSCPRIGHCQAHQPRDLARLPLPPWYTKTRSGLRLIPGVLANALAKHKRVIYVKQGYYHYRAGVYAPVDELHCKQIIRHYLRPDHVEMRQINDVQGQWTIEMRVAPEQLNARTSLINLRNGLYDLDRQTLIAHDPQLLSTIQLAVSFAAGAQAPRFGAFLNDCLDPATQLLVQELVGYLLIPETRAQKAFVLVGEGGAGKSTLLGVIQELLLGRANVANIAWQCLGDKFSTAELDGKLANIFADLPTRSIDDSNLFKSITGEDWLTAERKNKDPFTFKATARLVFSCNSIPKNLGDRSGAFYRRLVIVPFLPARPVAQRDLQLKDKLAGEAPGILNWALAGLMRLRGNGYRFTVSPASQAALNSYQVAGSSVLSFIEDACVVDPAGQVSAAQLYHAYQQYSGAAGLRAVSQKRFWTELKASFGTVAKERDTVTRRTLYYGIDLEDVEDFS